MRAVVFIHTNDKQLLGAKVSEFSLKRASDHPEKFEVHLIRVEEQAALHRRHGQEYLRNGGRLVWDCNDLQSFTPTRFLAPQLMGFQGRALVIDPDVFAVGDVNELFERDMRGKSIACRQIHPHDGRPPYYASSVMLLECAKLSHWQWDRDIERMFDFELDYHQWINLYLEDEDTIGLLEDGWNHFDTLDEHTRLLHNTARITQPWKTGLPVDFTKEGKPYMLATRRREAESRLEKRWRKILGKKRPKRTHYEPASEYLPHPDHRQERFFFTLLRECLESGFLSEDFVRDQITRQHVRPDALKLVAA